MIDSNLETWEERLREIAAEMDFPPTPDIAAGVRLRQTNNKRQVALKPWYASRLAWMAAAVLLLFALLLAVPQVRAAVFEFFQIGDIRIFPAAPTETPIFEESFAESLQTPSPVVALPTLPAFSVANLSGETTLADLESEMGDAVLLPEYPAGVGLPDKVYLQKTMGPQGILVWLEGNSTDKAWAVLHILTLDEGAFGGKFQVESLTGTLVNDQPAYWVEGQHMISFYNADGQIDIRLARLVEGNTLIWTVEEVTYRLETVLTLEEAVRMAESMK